MHLNPIGLPKNKEPFKKRFQLAVVTLDLKFGKQIADEASKRGIEARHYESMDKVPLSADTIIVKRNEHSEVSSEKVFVAEPQSSPRSIVDKAIETGYRKKKVAKAIVVIDPGKKTGAAFFADDILLRTETYFTNEPLIDDVAEFFSNHREAQRLILIGEGAPDFRQTLITQLTNKVPELTAENIVTVPEKNSSKLAGGKDEIAATIISWTRRRHKRL